MTKTTPRRLKPRFEVEWTAQAWTEVRALPPLARRPVMRAAAALARGAEVATDNQILLVARSKALPKATWETRTEGGHRLLYCIATPMGDDDRRRVWILCVVGVPRTSVSGAEARELGRRAETLRRIGGGIPHEVVRRTWILEMKRAGGA